MRFHSSNLTIKDQVHISLQNKLTIHRVQNKPLYHGNQGGLPQTLHPAGASFRAHDYNRGVNQGLTIEQSKDLGDSNQSVEKVPLYSGNLGRSYRMMFPMGASFRNRDSNQGFEIVIAIKEQYNSTLHFLLISIRINNTQLTQPIKVSRLKCFCQHLC